MALTQTRTALPLASDRNSTRNPYFQNVPGDETDVLGITLDRNVWEEMGSPEWVTITTRPGDELNEKKPDVAETYPPRVGGADVAKARKPSVLRAVIEAYLLSVGFTSEERAGYTFWYHPQLGGSRPLLECAMWWMGVEQGRTP